MKEVKRVELFKRLFDENLKANPSDKVLKVIYKTIDKLMENEKKQKRIISQISLSNKDYSTLFH